MKKPLLAFGLYTQSTTPLWNTGPFNRSFIIIQQYSNMVHKGLLLSAPCILVKSSLEGRRSHAMSIVRHPGWWPSLKKDQARTSWSKWRRRSLLVQFNHRSVGCRKMSSDDLSRTMLGLAHGARNVLDLAFVT
jgi:hypothetical protein